MRPDIFAALLTAVALTTILISFLYEVQKSKDKICRDEGHQWESVQGSQMGDPGGYRCTRCGRYA